MINKNLKKLKLTIFKKYHPAIKNIFGARIEHFVLGDSITVFYLREETLEELRVTGIVISEKHKGSEIAFKIFIQNEILISFSSNSPFIVAIIKAKSAINNKFRNI